MQPITLTTSADTQHHTRGDWERIAADHIAAIDDMGMTPAQDFELVYSLFLGVSLGDIATRLKVPQIDVKQRFAAMRDGLLDRRGVFPLIAQEALVAVLKRRSK